MKEQTDIRLLRQFIRLQGNPLDLAHPARVQRLLSPFAPEHLSRCPAAWQRLGRVAAKTWGLQDLPWKPDSSSMVHILLADHDQLIRACQWLGTLAAYRKLQKTIRGDVIRVLHEQLPDCFPAVYRQAANFRKWLAPLSQNWSPDQDLTSENITRCGLALLTDTLSLEIPAPILRRWLLQFPENICPNREPMGNDELEGKELLMELQNRGLILC